MSETFATEEIYWCLDLAQGRSYHTVLYISVLLYGSRKDRRTSSRNQNEDFHMINWQRVKSVFRLTRYFGSTDMNQLLVSSLLYIHPPTSTTVLSSTCQTQTSRNELSCAWLNRLTVGGRKSLSRYSPSVSVKTASGRKVWTGEMERDCILCSGEARFMRLPSPPRKQHAITSLKQHLLYPLVNPPARQHRKGM